MQILTRNEATHRAAHLHVSAIDVVVDIRDAQDTTNPTYPVTSTLTLTSDEERTFIDIAGEVGEVLLNGEPHAFDDDEDRVWVGGLPVGETRACTATPIPRTVRSTSTPSSSPMTLTVRGPAWTSRT